MHQSIAALIRSGLIAVLLLLATLRHHLLAQLPARLTTLGEQVLRFGPGRRELPLGSI